MVPPVDVVTFRNHVPDCQPRALLGMVEARSVDAKKDYTHTYESTSSIAMPTFAL